MPKVVAIACAALFLSMAVWADGEAVPTAAGVSGSLPIADRVIVHKAERRMYLMRGSQILREYHIALGLRPEGRKEEERDFRTPEGKYRLERRNPHSDYFLSIQISYPNDEDVARAKRLHVSPGNAIMIHGSPNMPRKSSEYYQHVDWTDGCIAVTNSDMVEIWLMTPPATPIEILP
jgi:murein L,D-transpeptidase YafK